MLDLMELELELFLIHSSSLDSTTLASHNLALRLISLVLNTTFKLTVLRVSFVLLFLAIVECSFRNNTIGYSLPSSDRSDVAYWLSRYDENDIAWYWMHRDTVDITAPIATEPFRTHSRMELVHVYDLMYIYIVGKDTFGKQRVQDANVHTRTLTTTAVSQSQQN